jgi:hypothetical protein
MEVEGRGEGEAVKKHRLAAGAWGDGAKMDHLIRTDWITPTIANHVLVEAAQAGSVEIVHVLLDAGASPDFSLGELDGKTALHVACEAGHEDVAAVLIPRMSTTGLSCKTRSTGCTAFKLLRRTALMGMARRLEALSTQSVKVLRVNGISPHHYLQCTPRLYGSPIVSARGLHARYEMQRARRQWPPVRASAAATRRAERIAQARAGRRPGPSQRAALKGLVPAREPAAHTATP